MEEKLDHGMTNREIYTLNSFWELFLLYFTERFVSRDSQPVYESEDGDI